MAVFTLDALRSGTGTSADATRAEDADLARLRYGARLIVGAFLLLGVVFSIGAVKISGGAEMVAALGSMTTVVGTIVGAYFGVQIGSHGKEAVEAERIHAERAARLALGKLDPEAADAVNQKLCEARAGSPRPPGHG
jgi:hypothetical protein